MLKTASSTLADSILITINDLLHKFNTDNMNHSYLTPIYEYALKNGIPLYESAINLIHTIIKIDPLIAFMNEEEISNSSSFRFVIKQIDEISNAPSKVISITDCKDLNQLFGLLDQRNPPKIHPFSTQYEMYLALQKEPKIDNNKSNRARILNSWSASINSNSMSSTTSLMMSPAIHAINESENVAIHQLEKKAVIFKTLDLPNYKPSNWRLIASLDEFAQMNE
ncbi:hypothetical protein GPJ56_006433 [Histomonas meleagridis]|uniref:uncharacterized protein n=1 Tax=Histomonas meleagridis TaxID=135588 RepID=UPI00355A8FD2|nr:hypothetical protein GPJ56_006433 [Histomonas meleagridis]KAH0796751.1 hypothetical protein GO595_010644 [Histomonas meleagridis]